MQMLVTGFRQPTDQMIPVIDDLPFQMLPVIQPGPTERFFVNTKPQRSYQPELCFQCHAGPAYGSRVARNFRLMQNDIESGLIIHSKSHSLRVENANKQSIRDETLVSRSATL